ncbi:ribosomal-protein-alanine acetyltransferase [Pseudoalteromonas rubra]|uniref:Ribosomal-protein-alanine acetyltransferase n=1 Tax=Pseudoalteromonas rubra TaxID=43658 RepID=A0A5S3WHI4_9GAMM|nr:GNAT family N-acetyltransferase/peptidase C39 family protein [Pseudoalteromonas rubra]TMP25573.1 ribosomal-protein-alanine acetyltransferase [Pseudoalteromonas rubra]TMP31015.1 ribosomal-protein-alanine acetyltransferase [Pseudoalteromonas rubra]
MLQAAMVVEKAQPEDLAELVELEARCFSSDRLSRRQFKHHIGFEHSLLLTARLAGELVGYGLLWLHQGTRLARLYSLAVSQQQQGKGIASQLMTELESQAAQFGWFYMRLEVAKRNTAAIALYKKLGYRVFGEYHNYYEDHDDALRMQKCIRKRAEQATLQVAPWYQQTTEFTCGPASLMMAMASIDASCMGDQSLELEIWREATTIFMTSGHGGCHPFGLALAAERRGFATEVVVNTAQPLFIDGVRSEQKKQVMTLVHEQFKQECEYRDIPVHCASLQLEQVELWLSQGSSILALISTYRLNGKKAPHWVLITGIDALCLYVNDPDVEDEQQAIDCQQVPIAREDFERMASFGASKLSALVVLHESF